MRLGQACDIQTGYTARGRLEAAAAGVLVIQLRDVLLQGGVDPSRLSRVDLTDVLDRYLVRAGDVVFRSRGDWNTAAAIDERLREPALVVLPLVIIRPKRELVDPAYIAWFINHRSAQRYFDSCARGTGLRMIPMPCLENLEIATPPLETQRRVVEIDRLATRETELLGELAKKRKAFTEFALMDQVRKAPLHGRGAGRPASRQPGKPAGISKRTDA